MHTADPLSKVNCPSKQQIDELLSGVHDGSIGLWGSPFNQQLEWMMDPGLLEFSVQLVHDLADRYNFTNRGTTFATHDVPGITRGVVPVFAKNGIEIVSIGSKPICTVMNGSPI